MERFAQDMLLLEKLAAGGMAEVYRAKQLGYGGFEKTVAVKRILPHYASSEEFKNMFRLEANLSALLQHPNIVQIFSNGDYEGYLYLVMEFVDGKNLRQVLAKADKAKVRIPIEIACHLIAEAAKGLSYAHTFADEKTGQPLEVVHRDMSPQNIMLSYDGGVKIVDFGIAKAAARADMTRAGVLKGKFGYMSPEQAQGQKLDCRTDIFALGIILFETLTQRRLFTTDDDLRTLQLVKECRVPRPSRYNPAVSPSLDRIVMKALARERGERYSQASDFYADLLRFMNQTYPKFIPTDLAKFMKQLFVDDITDERKKREKLAAEAPARVSAPIGRQALAPEPAGAKKKKKGKGEEATVFDQEEKTQISQISDSEPGLAASNEVEAAFVLPQAAPTSEVAARSEESTDPSHAGESQRPHPDANFDLAPKPEGALTFESESSDAETRVTQDGPPPDILPPPGESTPGFAIPQASPLENFSLSMPQDSRHGLPPARDGARPLTVQLQDDPVYMRSPGSTGVRPLPGMKARRRNRRPLVYGLTLALLIAFIALKEEEKPASEREVASETKPVSKTPLGPAAGEKHEMIKAEVPAPADGERGVASAPPVAAPEASAPASTSPAKETPEPAAPAATNEAPPAVAPTPERTTASTGPAKVDISEERRGYLTIDARPRATEVYIDGKLLRAPAGGAPVQTPLQRFEVTEGTHKIRLRNPVFRAEWEGTVDVKGDRIFTLTPTLK